MAFTSRSRTVTDMSETLSKFKEKMDNQLMCAVCLEQYMKPKSLPCHHSFCLKCIQRLPGRSKGDQYLIKCPSCRVEFPLPQEGASELPAAFHINTLLDLRRELTTKKRSTSTPELKVNSTIIQEVDEQLMCAKHKDPLKVYCDTCRLVICRDCTFGEHKKHSFELISDCYSKYHHIIETKLNVIKGKLADNEGALGIIDKTEREVVTQAGKVTEEIRQHARELIRMIQKSEEELVGEVEKIAKEKQQHLSRQRVVIKNDRHQLNTCKETIERNLHEMSQVKVVMIMEDMFDQMQVISSGVSSTGIYSPIEVANIKFTKYANTSTGIGSISSNGCANVVIEPPPSGVIRGKKSIAEVSFQSHNGTPYSPPPSSVTCEVCSPGFDHPVKCEVSPTSSRDRYRVAFSSQHSGYQLMVKVGGISIPGGVYTVPYSPVKSFTLQNEGYNLAVCENGNVLVVEKDANTIAVLNKDGKKLKSIGIKKKKEVQLSLPHGVAVCNDGHIIVTDSHRLQELSADGAPIKAYGSTDWGSDRSSFNYPTGVTVHPTTGQIFVADQYNNRVQVLNADMTFSHLIRNLPDGERFKKAYDVALDSEGYLYVAEGSNHCITKLTATGDYVNRFGSFGSSPGQLNTPSALAISDNFIYVVEWGNNRVSVFNTDGQFLHCISDSFNHPWGVAVDRSGNLYVSDTGNKKIVVF